MKLKLIAVAMMALLVLTVVPMAVTAAKPTRDTYDVHSFDPNTLQRGPVVGSVTVTTNAHAHKYAWSSELTPGGTYKLNVVSIRGKPFPISGTVCSATANPQGTVNAHGTMSQETFALIQLRQSETDLIFLAVPTNI